MGTNSRIGVVSGEGDEEVKKIHYMKTKVVQHVPRILFNVINVFKLSSFQVFKFSKFSGSQRLSDFQTFF